MRDAVEAGLDDGRRMLANAVRMAVETGELRPDTDIDQFVFELTGIILVAMQNQRLFKDKDAKPPRPRRLRASGARHTPRQRQIGKE